MNKFTDLNFVDRRQTFLEGNRDPNNIRIGMLIIYIFLKIYVNMSFQDPHSLHNKLKMFEIYKCSDRIILTIYIG